MGDANQTIEQNFDCPFCGEPVSVLLDLSVGRQTFVEDCEVCCRPMEISYACEEEAITEFGVGRAY